jgi:hypothetical protein
MAVYVRGIPAEPRDVAQYLLNVSSRARANIVNGSSMFMLSGSCQDSTNALFYHMIQSKGSSHSTE